MGIELKNSTLIFFESQLADHSCVETYIRLPVEDDFVFAVKRKGNLPLVNVHASDAYHYDLADFLSRPKQIKRGDFILIARAESDFDPSLVAIAQKESIGIGKIGKLKGALNRPNVWQYRSREERETQKK